MQNVVLLIAIVYLWIGGLSPLAAQNGIKLKRYTTEDGLGHNICYKMFQDSQGYLWVGTDDGLSRFDGTDWIQYNLSDGLTSAFPIAIDERAPGELWIATWRGGVNILKNDSIYNLPVLDGNTKINGIKVVNDSLVYTWSYGTLHELRYKNGQWVNETWHYPYAFPNKAFEMHHVTKLREHNIDFSFVSFQDADYRYIDGKLLILGISPNVYEYINVKNTKSFFEADKPQDILYCVTKSPSSGDYWFGARKKIYQVNTLGEREVYTEGLPNENIYSLEVVADKYIYFITGEKRYAARTLYRYDIKKRKSINLSELFRLKAAPGHFYLDKEQNLWLSTDGSGLICIYPSLFHNYLDETNNTNQFVNVFGVDREQKVWVGTKGGGFYLENDVFIKEKLRITKKKNGRLINIKDILFADKPELGDFLISTDVAFKRYKQPNFIYDDFLGGEVIMLDSSGRVVVVLNNLSKQNVHEIKTHNPIPNLTSLENNQETFPLFYYEEKGHLAISKSSNLNKRNLYVLENDSSLFRFNRDYSKKMIVKDFPFKNINRIYEDIEGNLWVGTESGLVFLEKKEDCYDINKILTTSDGLVSNKCRTIAVDQNGLLWIGTPHGLMSYDGTKLKLFTTKQGLLANGINDLYIDQHNQLWIATSKGVSKMDAQSSPTDTDVPKLFLEKMEVNGKVVSPTNKSYIFESSTFLNFSFKAITFNSPEKLTYQYRLNNEEWIDIKDHYLSFSSLRAGHYLLQIRARKINSDWAEKDVITFQITPPVWFTWWAITVYIVTTILLFIGGMYIQRKRLRKKEEERIHINKLFTTLELKALQAQMNPHFIFNALNAIQGFILDSDELKANEYLSNFSQLMRLYLESSKSKYITIQQEVKLLRLYIELEGLRFGSRFEFVVDADTELNSDKYKIPGMLVQPFAENAINHGLAYKKGRGHLSVYFRKVENYLLCIIDDDGVGRARATEIRKSMRKSHKSRAMQIVDERLDAINLIDGIDVEINIIDKKDSKGDAAGTQVEIKFPLKKNDTQFNH